MDNRELLRTTFAYGADVFDGLVEAANLFCNARNHIDCFGCPLNIGELNGVALKQMLPSDYVYVFKEDYKVPLCQNINVYLFPERVADIIGYELPSFYQCDDFEADVSGFDPLF